MAAKPKNGGEYLKTKVMTASPEELQLMLYDGAIRFCEQGRVAMENKEIEKSYKLLSKAENIVMELMTAMRDDVSPEICGNLRRLYLFCYEKMVTTNVSKNIDDLDEAIKILKHIRETWLMLMDKLRAERAAGAENGESADASERGANEASDSDIMLEEVGSTINFEG